MNAWIVKECDPGRPPDLRDLGCVCRLAHGALREAECLCGVNPLAAQEVAAADPAGAAMPAVGRPSASGWWQ